MLPTWYATCTETVLAARRVKKIQAEKVRASIMKHMHGVRKQAMCICFLLSDAFMALFLSRKEGLP